MPRRDAQGRDTPLRSGRGGEGRDGDGGDGGARGEGGREGMGLILTLYDPWQIENALRGNGVWLTGIFEEPEPPWFLHYCFQAGLWAARSRQKNWFALFYGATGGSFIQLRHIKTLWINLYISVWDVASRKAIRFCCSLSLPEESPLSPPLSPVYMH